MMKQVDLYDQLQEAKLNWEQSQTTEDFDKFEALEDDYEKAHEYQTAAEHDEELQIKYLKALDYGDVLCEGWRRFYCCKAGGAGNHCGLAYPSKLWLQEGRKASLNKAERLMPGNWKYKCCCMWEYLEEEAHDHPDSPAARWFNDMLAAHGSVSEFPHVGCGANYVPWKRGASMVCEIQLRNSSWEAFLADHTPPALDDQFKKIRYDALTQAFSALTPEFMMSAIPMTMPMTYLKVEGGKKMEGVAHYPIDQWMLAGNPTFTNEKWAMMCLMIAEKGKELASSRGLNDRDLEVFDKMFTVSTEMKETGVYR